MDDQVDKCIRMDAQAGARVETRKWRVLARVDMRVKAQVKRVGLATWVPRGSMGWGGSGSPAP